MPTTLESKTDRDPQSYDRVQTASLSLQDAGKSEGTL
ncbi:hypothetical protein AB7M49_003876 [Bradyrhizobium elkanii]